MVRKIVNFIKKNNHFTITRAAFIIAFFSLGSRLLGLLRDRLLASTFGAGDVLDSYYAAFRIPDFVYNLIILGTLSSAFIPVFTKHLNSKGGEKSAFELANILLNFLSIFLAAACLVLFLLAPWLMKIITPGFSDEKIAEVVVLSRIMFLSPFFLGLSNLFSSVLNAYKKFFFYSLAPVVYNIGIIFSILFLIPILGTNALAWGVSLGALLHLLIQLPSIHNMGFRYKPVLKINHPGLKTIGRLMLPRTLGLAASQINLMVITGVASMLAAGSVAIFNLAANLQYFAVGIIGISFATAAFPVLSDASSLNNVRRFVVTLSRITRQILFFVIPISVFMILLRAEIVRVILGSGRFDWEDTILTFESLGFFALSLFAQCLVPLFSRGFYALEDTKTPVIISIISIVVNIILSIFLGKFMGVLGLALAFSIASILNILLLVLFLKFRIGFLDDLKVVISGIKIIIAALIASLILQLAKDFIGEVVNMRTFLGVFLKLMGSGIAGVSTYLLLCWFFRLREFIAIMKSLKHFRINKAPTILENGRSADNP